MLEFARSDCLRNLLRHSLPPAPMSRERIAGSNSKTKSPPRAPTARLIRLRHKPSSLRVVRPPMLILTSPKQPTPEPLHDPIDPPAQDPPSKPLHDPAGDPTYEPPQPVTDPTPNPASDPPPEMPGDQVA